MYANIRGLKGKKTGLIEILQENQPHLFLLTETQLRSDISPKIANYVLYSKKREGKIGGGVAILVRVDIVPIIT